MHELEQYKQAERDRQEQAEQDRRAAMEERQQDFDDWKRTAETWPEALQKQSVLYADEVGQWTPELEEQFPDDYFRPGAEACNRAIEIWREVEAAKQEKIAELKAELESIQDEIRIETSEKLASEDDRRGWEIVAEAIKKNKDLNDWLDW